VYDVRSPEHSSRGARGASRTEGPLSVAYVCPSWPPDDQANGIVMYITEITKGLRARGHTSTLLVPHVTQPGVEDDIYDLGEFHEHRALPGRIVDYLGYRTNPARVVERKICRSIIAATRRAVVERGVQLLEMEESYGWSLNVRRTLSIPLVVRLHGPWFLNGAIKNVTDDRKFRKRVWREGEAIRLADGVSASSRDVLERTRSYYNLPLENARVIYPPSPIVPAEACWSLDDCDPQGLLFVGRFDRHKGGDLAIEAFARVAERFPEARLRFAGPDQGFLDDERRSWKIQEFIHDRIRNPRIRDRIEWLGQLPNSVVMDLRRKSLVSVVSSRYDNFPTTVTEAMAMGCPIVAGRTGGILEQITHEVNGLLCERDDVSDLADKLGRLLGDPALAARLGRRARLDCEAMLSPGAISEQMAAFYGLVLDG
jgi:glycosyltransferase involved in cell wall biosynthesis